MNSRKARTTAVLEILGSYVALSTAWKVDETKEFRFGDEENFESVTRPPKLYSTAFTYSGLG